jgi:4-amino-4-deoxy-L-arabinose transferase-like glycosyltransferase
MMSADAAQDAHAQSAAEDRTAEPERQGRRRSVLTRFRTLSPGFAVAAGLLGAWALFQNLFRIGTPQVLADELTYSSVAWTYVHGQAKTPRLGGSMLTPAPDNFEHPPLAKLLFGLAQELVGHPSITVDRCVSALCAILTGVLLGVWVARIAGRWIGLLAFALVTVLPEAASGSVGRFSRFGMLDPVAELFMVASLLLGWEWLRRTGRGGWLFAALSGVAVGCAAAAKENGFLGLIGPAILIIALAARSARKLAVRTGQAVLAVAASVLVFTAAYLPVGHPLTSIRYLIEFQSAHSRDGHSVGFAGRVTMYPPWWANLWFAGHSWGTALTSVLVVAVLAAVCLRRDLVVLWLLAALAVPFLFHCFATHVALGFYWVMWTPAFFALAALGMQALVEAAGRFVRDRGSAVRKAVPITVAVALLAVPVSASAAESGRVAQIKPIGVKNLPGVMKRNGLTGPIITAGIAWWLTTTYLPKTGVRTNVPNASALNGVETIVIGAPVCNVVIDQSVRALVAINLPAGHVREVYTDADMTVYAVTGNGALLVPTPAQVSAERPGKPKDHC